MENNEIIWRQMPVPFDLYEMSSTKIVRAIATKKTKQFIRKGSCQLKATKMIEGRKSDMIIAKVEEVFVVLFPELQIKSDRKEKISYKYEESLLRGEPMFKLYNWINVDQFGNHHSKYRYRFSKIQKKYLTVFKPYNEFTLIHRAVANLFIENPKDKSFVRHLDGNLLNNRFDNLQWTNEKHDSDCFFLNKYKNYDDRIKLPSVFIIKEKRIEEFVLKSFVEYNEAKNNIHLTFSYEMIEDHFKDFNEMMFKKYPKLKAMVLKYQ